MKFLGHLELMKLFERVFRRHKYPLKFSEGFNPHPKMTFASPLSVGYATKGDLMEVILTEMMPIETVLQTAFPEGIQIIEAKYVDSKTALMAGIDSSEYLLNVELKVAISDLAEQFEHFLTQETILYEKKNKRGQVRSVDAKPQIYSAKLIFEEDGEFTIRCLLKTSSQGNLNPEVFVKTFLKFCRQPEETAVILVERLAMFDEAKKPLYDLA
jgi:radical SAM-linked protein